MGDLKLHIPTDASNVPPQPLAARPDSLKGLRIGLLDNGKEFSNIVLEGLGSGLESQDDAGEIIFWRKGFPSKIAPFIEEMASDVDVAISGVGH